MIRNPPLDLLSPVPQTPAKREEHSPQAGLRSVRALLWFWGHRTGSQGSLARILHGDGWWCWARYCPSRSPTGDEVRH